MNQMTMYRISDMVTGAWLGTVLFCTVRVIWSGDYWWGVLGFLVFAYLVLKQVRTWRSQEMERLVYGFDWMSDQEDQDQEDQDLAKFRENTVADVRHLLQEWHGLDEGTISQRIDEFKGF